MKKLLCVWSLACASGGCHTTASRPFRVLYTHTWKGTCEMFFGTNVSRCGTRLSRSFANDSRVLFKWDDSPASDSEILAEWTYNVEDGLPASDARATVIGGHSGPRKIKRGSCIFQNDLVTEPRTECTGTLEPEKEGDVFRLIFVAKSRVEIE